MSKVKITGHASGSGTLTLTGPNTNSDRTITLPDVTGTVLTLGGGAMTGTLTNFTSTGIDDNADALAITINSDETVGIGVTPETTHSTWTALQVGGTGNLLTEKSQAAGGQMVVGQNVYMDAGGDFTYIVTDEASYYRQYSGTHSFFVASSGSADATISPTNALEIKADGRGVSQFTAHAWVNLNQTGTQAIRDSHNVSSISDQATGSTRVNYSNNIGNSSTDACAVAMGKAGGIIYHQAESASYWQGEIRNDSGSAEDTATLTVVVFGD